MGEDAIVAVFVQMLRAGVIDDEMVNDAADECEAAGNPSAAHQVRCLIVEASATPATEAAKQRRRASFRTIDGGNGA